MSSSEGGVVADTHNDLLMLVCRRPKEQWVDYFRDHWLPQLQEGGVNLQVLPVFIDDEFRPEGALRETLHMIEAAHRIAEGCADSVSLCLDGEDIDKALDAGRIALVLALEGCNQIDTDVEVLQTLHRLGVRVASFAHWGRSALADGSGEHATGSRLTSVGVEAVALCEEIGVMLDISHLGPGAVDHILELATRPIIATHSSVRALHDHHRNLTDEQLKSVTALGGLVCINFFSGFLAPGAATMDDLVAHIRYAVDLLGPDSVGLGPDFVYEVFDEKIPMCDRPRLLEGMDVMEVVPGLEGPRGLPLVTEALLASGMERNVVDKVRGGNVLQLFRKELGVAGRG
jgi:membrane dipeptidase